MNIGPYTLHPGVIWKNEFDAPAVSQQIQYTILGTPKISNMPLPKREMVFEAKDSGNRARGYFSRELLDYLRNAEESGTIIQVTYRGISYNVIVKAGGIKVTPKMEIESVSNADVFTGTITLQEV